MEAQVPVPVANTTEVMLNPDLLRQIQQVAEIMAASAVTIPEHLRGKKGDCLAIVMKAAQWGMEPFSVASKTFVIGGKLGYEAQLVSAVVNATAPLQKRFEFEWTGNWEGIAGKFEKRKGNSGRDYFAATYKDSEEVGLGVTISGLLRGESEPRTLNISLLQCHPRNSTLWATDPKQQIAYVAIKRWVSLYCPEVLLGVPMRDDIVDSHEKVVDGEVLDQQRAEVSSARSQEVLNKARNKRPEKAANPKTKPEPEKETAPKGNGALEFDKDGRLTDNALSAIVDKIRKSETAMALAAVAKDIDGYSEKIHASDMGLLRSSWGAQQAKLKEQQAETTQEE